MVSDQNIEAERHKHSPSYHQYWAQAAKWGCWHQASSSAWCWPLLLGAGSRTGTVCPFIVLLACNLHTYNPNIIPTYLCTIFLYNPIWCTSFVIMLFQSDFSGRVVNNDHFLYWGDIIKTNEEGIDFHVQVSWQAKTCSFPKRKKTQIMLMVNAKGGPFKFIIRKCRFISYVSKVHSWKPKCLE